MKKLLILMSVFAFGLCANAQMNITIKLNNGEEFVHENVKEMTFSKTNEDMNHDYVDLGLPSGTLWATCNIGASTSEEYGDYFARATD